LERLQRSQTAKQEIAAIAVENTKRMNWINEKKTSLATLRTHVLSIIGYAYDNSDLVDPLAVH
jgi:hypothetical protein